MSFLRPTLAIVAATLLAAAPSALAGTSLPSNEATQTVTVQVQPIQVMTVSTSSITLTIAEATPGSNPDIKNDATSSITWTNNVAGQKITVQSDAAWTKYHLAVVALSPTNGTAQSWVTFNGIGTTARDFILGIVPGVGSAGIKYAATVTAGDGVGTEAHNIIFTITNQ